MLTTKYLIDTNILIYHTKGSQVTFKFLSNLIDQRALNISILTKIEFLGWDKHTPDGFEKCNKLMESANIYPVDEEVANRAIELKRKVNIKLADAVIGATALINNLKLATRNVADFKKIAGLDVVNPFD
ncbi:MAG: type II toxin-antitoxin system VapC family toxin [Thermodesulfobacteriota bacterium]|nr:type II toxin-antitoxin system VapC family toxin [Thermodesulfobacteriota bacterium]